MGIAPGGAIGLEDDGEGFTPVRRKLSTINTRLLQTDSEVEWTATRCNRLLRALTSRVAILKKDLARYQLSTTAKSQLAQDASIKLQKRSIVQDEDWGQSKKRIRRTYSARGEGIGYRTNSQASRVLLTKETKNLIPGEILVPTPVLNRARGNINEAQSPLATNPLRQLSQNGDGAGKRKKAKQNEGQLHLSEMMRGIRRKIPAGRYTTYEGIYNALETLLKATASNETIVPRKRPRSLLSMCLMAVPQYIAQQEALLETELEETGERSAIKNRDISTEIYDDLEAFGSFGRGWKQLRIIVRSHGIKVISDAIVAGLLDSEFCGVLVRLSMHTGATEEAQTLLSSLLSITKVAPPKTVFSRFGDDECNSPLSLLWSFVDQQRCFPFQYRELTKLVSNDLLPLNWVATRELGSLWTKAIQSLSYGGSNADAVSFLETILSTLATMLDMEDSHVQGYKEEEPALFEATKQTFSSLLTTLVSIVILGKETTGQGTLLESKPTPPLYEQIPVLLSGSLIRWKLSGVINSHGTLLLLANIFLGNWGSDGDFSDLELLTDHLRTSRKSNGQAKYLAAFVCSVARCCGRGASTLGFEHLEHLHLLLESLADGRELDAEGLLYGIIVDSAFEFSRHAPDRQHLEYAARTGAKFHMTKTKPTFNSTPKKARRSARVGFRWEEGISEWVTSTPSWDTCKSSQKPPPPPRPWNESECDTPIKPLIRSNLDKGVETLLSRSPLLLSSGPDSADVLRSLEAIPSPTYSISSPDDLDISASASIASPSLRNPSANIDAGDEIPDNTPQRGSESSSDSESGNDSFTSPYQSEDQLDESFTSCEASLVSCSSDTSRGRRQYVDRVPRLSRRVLRHSLQWQLFEESDDELSSQSTFSSSREEILVASNDELSFQSTSSSSRVGFLREVRNVSVSDKKHSGKSTAKRQKVSMKLDSSLLDESEDELCI